VAVLSCAGPAGSVVAPGADGRGPGAFGRGPGAFVFASSQWTPTSVDKRIFHAERSCVVTGINATIDVAGTAPP
jgi:hypothetical protein